MPEFFRPWMCFFDKGWASAECKSAFIIPFSHRCGHLTDDDFGNLFSMSTPILFIQGGGDDGYHADQPLVDALQEQLGDQYRIRYPEMPSDPSAPDFGWLQQIGNQIAEAGNDFLLAGHSLGASMILKYLSENHMTNEIKGIFLLATPFWSGDEEWKRGLKLREDFAENLPTAVPMFLYHCRDDEEVPFSQFEEYRRQLPRATFRAIARGGHQFNDRLAVVTEDIQALPSVRNK